MKRLLTILFIITVAGISRGGSYKTTTDFLAPKSFKAEYASYLNSKYEQILYKNYYGENEKKCINALKDLSSYAQTSPSEEDLKTRVSAFLSILQKALILSSEHLNMSLFPYIEEQYLALRDDKNVSPYYIDYLKYILYTMGTQGTSIFDHDATQNDEKLVYRQTQPERLEQLDQVMLNEIDPLSKEIVFYDIGASYGSTTLDSYTMLNAKFPNAALKILPADLNMNHYILYDIKNKKRVFFNGAEQLREIYSLDVAKHNTPFFHYASGKDKYIAIMKNLKNKLANKERFAANDDFILEKVVLLDPALKSLKETTPLQHDAKKTLDTKLPKANVIRIANLLQYFTSTKIKATIFNNLLAKLKDGGMLLFNYDQVTEDSKYLFALKKQGKHVDILMINNDPQINFLNKLFGSKKNYSDLKKLKTALDYIGFSYTDVDAFDSLRKIHNQITSAA